MKLISLLILFITLVLSLSLPGLVSAFDLADDSTGRVIGVASEALDCLAVGTAAPAAATGVVNLTWQGRVEHARLIVTVSGAEAAHTIKVNGQGAAQTPIYPDGQPCGEGQSFYLDIPPRLLAQGANTIELTNDAQPGDNWTAAYVRLEVLGDLVINVPNRSGEITSADLTTLATAFTFNFTNALDGTTQEARAQIPDSYAGAPTPLLVTLHQRTGNMFFGEGEFGAVTNTKGWLLASPELHRHWPPTSPPQPQPPPGQYEYASLESQYDILATVKYMVQNYNVDPRRIYITGYSMGAQTATVTAAKYPHLFAAVFDNKGPTDMYAWYYEQLAYYGGSAGPVDWMERECYLLNGSGVPSRKDPTENPFCYQRRSSLNFARNFIHVPISMTHSISDALVPISHSRNLRNAINSYGPDQPVSVFEENSHDPLIDGGPPYHEYEPDPMSVLNFLQSYTLNNNPTHINITSDESKSFYWLNLVQTGDPHFSHVEATYSFATQRVTALISDTNPLTVAFNLGSTPILIPGVEPLTQPGMGLSGGTYQIQGGGYNYQQDYLSGYLTVPITLTGQVVLTISLLPGTGVNLKYSYLPVIIK